MERGDDAEGDHDRNDMRAREREPPQPGKKRLDQASQRRLADPTEAKRGNGDAKLAGGEVGVELGERVLKRLGIPLPLGDQPLNTAAAHRDHRKFGGNEEAVGRHQ
jgi:hypothetical protein